MTLGAIITLSLLGIAALKFSYKRGYSNGYLQCLEDADELYEEHKI